MKIRRRLCRVWSGDEPGNSISYPEAVQPSKRATSTHFSSLGNRAECEYVTVCLFSNVSLNYKSHSHTYTHSGGRRTRMGITNSLWDVNLIHNIAASPPQVLPHGGHLGSSGMEWHWAMIKQRPDKLDGNLWFDWGSPNNDVDDDSFPSIHQWENKQRLWHFS